jgi:hypothetical protein
VYDYQPAVSAVRKVIGNPNNRTFAIAVSAYRAYPGNFASFIPGVTEISRSKSDWECSYFDGATRCHTAMVGYVDAVGYSPSVYNTSGSSGERSWVYSGIPLVTGSTLNISNPGAQGFSANRVSLSATVGACTSL